MSRPKVLSVDDRPENLLVIREVLHPLRLDVVSAPSGEAGLELVSRDDFAVILLDVMMPEMDGFEVLDRLRATTRAQHTPVILVTARDMHLSEIERAYRRGAVDFVSKPIPIEILRAKVNVFVTLHQVSHELRQRDAALAQKDRHIAVLAHDLRSPLHSIALGAKLLLRSSADERARRTLERMQRTAERMSGMIDDLFDYARTGRGSLPIRRVATDLGDLCREIIDEAKGAGDSDAIDLVTVGNLYGEWDRARLQQALSNLIANALRHGDGRATVEVRGGAAEVEIAVNNAGPPIPDALLPVLFEPFERGNEHGPGLGLGLFIVKAVAHAHGGDVAVASSAADGTTFTLRLPRALPI